MYAPKYSQVRVFNVYFNFLPKWVNFLNENWPVRLFHFPFLNVWLEGPPVNDGESGKPFNFNFSLQFCGKQSNRVANKFDWEALQWNNGSSLRYHALGRCTCKR